MDLHPGEASLAHELAQGGVVPVVELPSAECAEPLCKALAAAGCRVVEITLRTTAAVEALAGLRASCPDMIAGAGTVRTVSQAREAAGAGAKFVVSPSMNTEVVDVCRSMGVPVLPGACTPTEVELAVRSGCHLVKFFPAEAMGGIAALNALRGPFRNVSFVPTGGIGPGNLASYLRLGNVVACGGSWLVAPDLLLQGRFDQVQALTREALTIAAGARTEAAHG